MVLASTVGGPSASARDSRAAGRTGMGRPSCICYADICIVARLALALVMLALCLVCPSIGLKLTSTPGDTSVSDSEKSVTGPLRGQLAGLGGRDVAACKAQAQAPELRGKGRDSGKHIGYLRGDNAPRCIGMQRGRSPVGNCPGRPSRRFHTWHRCECYKER
ncbi:hypothetical protein C8Q77DRAFT_1182355 [Trametes polyzona]|nr:hypothetical protein C8Q77DRAFT_1182355 [Trametes polyzona]